MEERYVSVETAKLLKERGFDAVCRSFYTICGDTVNSSIERDDANNTKVFDYCTNSSLETYDFTCDNGWGQKHIAAPTQQMAHDFIMEKMELLVHVDCDRPMYEKFRLVFKFHIIDMRTNKIVYIDEEYHDKYKDAMEKGIYKALNEFENLTAERK